MSRRIGMRGSLLALAAVALIACAHNPEPRADSGSAAAEVSDSTRSAIAPLAELTGRVTNGGTDRFVVTTLRGSDGRTFLLTGGLIDELRRLGGADIMARGVLDSSATGRSLDVREYELLAIDGQRPHVGVLIAHGDELWLAAGDTLRLVPALDALRQQVGAKIWVVGATGSTAKELRVGSYGVLAPAR